MSNLEKHKKDLLAGWLGEDESVIPTHARCSHLLEPAQRTKAPRGKGRPVVAKPAEAKPELALAREAAPPKAGEKHSPAASWDHLQKQKWLPKLRRPSPRAPSPRAQQ